jgi:acetate kinase
MKVKNFSSFVKESLMDDQWDPRSNDIDGLRHNQEENEPATGVADEIETEEEVIHVNSDEDDKNKEEKFTTEDVKALIKELGDRISKLESKNK